MIISEVLDMLIGVVLIRGKMKLYAYCTWTDTVQPGELTVAAQTAGPLAGHATAASETPQIVRVSFVESMLVGVMLFTKAVTSAWVVGPPLPEAELLAKQLKSFEQSDPRTAAYRVASLAALLRW
jgi:hypothetical protein